MEPEKLLNYLITQRNGTFAPGDNIPDDSEEVEKETTEGEETANEKVTISIIECKKQQSPAFLQILSSLNNYLIRNHGAATDFHLVKDIVERNIDAMEEDINLTISIPIYLGLMGTMAGIIIGLFNIPDLSFVLDGSAKDAQLTTGISLLINGVKVAMVASFTGLFLTILNSGSVFKGSRNLVERRKNELYTFVQTELLPVLNQSLGSTLVSMQRNLQLFNDKFTVNLDRLSGIFNANYEAIAAQEKVLSMMEKIDISQVAKFNINVLKELNYSVEKLQQFNSYLTNLNLFVDSSQRLTFRAEELLHRTMNFEEIAADLAERLNDSKQLMEYLTLHFKNLEQHKTYVQGAIAEVGFSISDTFKDLRQQINISTESVRQFSVDEAEALKTALSESRTNLSNLGFLETITKDVSTFRSNSVNQGENIDRLLKNLNTSLKENSRMLEKIQQSSLTYKVRHLFVKEKIRRDED